MKKTLLTSLVVISLIISPLSVFAWTEPENFPPGGNVGAPIHIGTQAQTKAGALTILGDTNAATKGFMVGGDGNNGSNALILQNAAQNLIYGNVDTASQGNLLNLQIEGVTKFIIDKDGKVGIGIAAPTQKLDVAGDVNITGSYRVNGVPIAVGGGTEWTTSGNNIYNANIGNVGIGTGAAIPTEKLDVRGNIFLQGNDGFNAAGETAQLTLGDGNHFIKAINGGGVEIGSYMNMDPIRFTFNGIEVMKIISTGYVYAPMYRLSSPITRYYVINPSEFTGYYYDTPFEIKDFGASIGSYNNAWGVGLFAPVHLPTGATITEMKAYIYRNDPAFGCSVNIDFYKFDTQLRYPKIAQIFGNSHTDGWRELWAGSVINEIINNAQYGYGIMASINVNDDKNDAKLGKIVITYTIDAPLP